jgi:hypothetical protein
MLLQMLLGMAGIWKHPNRWFFRWRLPFGSISPLYISLATHTHLSTRKPRRTSIMERESMSRRLFGDYLGLDSLDLVDWGLVGMSEVPAGPWSLYDRSENREAIL